MKTKIKTKKLRVYRNAFAIFYVICMIIGKNDAGEVALIISAVADMIMIAIDDE